MRKRGKIRAIRLYPVTARRPGGQRLADIGSVLEGQDAGEAHEAPKREHLFQLRDRPGEAMEHTPDTRGPWTKDVERVLE